MNSMPPRIATPIIVPESARSVGIPPGAKRCLLIGNNPYITVLIRALVENGVWIQILSEEKLPNQEILLKRISASPGQVIC